MTGTFEQASHMAYANSGKTILQKVLYAAVKEGSNVPTLKVWKPSHSHDFQQSMCAKKSEHSLQTMHPSCYSDSFIWLLDFTNSNTLIAMVCTHCHICSVVCVNSILVHVLVAMPGSCMSYVALPWRYLK